MDPKELRANAPLNISVSDDGTKYVHSSPTLPSSKSKSYHEIATTSMGKVDATAVRPCAIIGPDRVLNHTSSDVYLKKAPVDPWPFSDTTYRQPPDYPNKLSEYPPTRNISPRQTFQENMQRIMVPPTYNSIKNSEENSLKNTKINMPQEAKYCDVPYNINSVTNELKSVRNPDLSMSSVNPAYSRAVPHYAWSTGVNIRPPRPYGAPEIYQYQDYPSCVGPRPVTIPHPHRVHREEAAQVYSERLYQEANIRFKPYPVLKEKHQQTRYDYINNYQNTFQPPVSFPPHKYDLQKSIHQHPFPSYSQVPLKYLDRRVHESFVDGYQRSNHQPNFNPQFHNQVIHPAYGPGSGNCIQNKSFTDMSAKAMSNKLPYETNNKIYVELDTSRNKGYPMPDNVYYNDMNHSQHMRSDILLPNHPTLNMHSMPQHQIYRRENIPLKHYEYSHHRNLDQPVNLNYSLSRLPLQFSPNTIAISPSDSNTSNDTTHTMGTSQEDCGYVSQSSTNSVRSLDGANMSRDRYRRHDYNIHNIPRNILHINGSDKFTKNKMHSPSKKNINVRQFLQMWNEEEDETSESNKEIVAQVHPSNFSVQSKTASNQEQLYVLGLVNVPSEELGKYEHIQKISKLPENIKGYNNIELLNQYEELLESPTKNNYKMNPKLHKDHISVSKRSNEKEIISLPRPVSPLDVEAKISQSVIHKEVGCNFEIKPCSPEMLNVEVATPIQNILGERIIEKVANPINNMAKSPRLSINDDDKKHTNKIPSCNMVNKQFSVNNYANGIKNNYNSQDFDSASGICLASLPRLDNDIELNFPEINQQFIKANKIESDGHLFQKDLAQLNLNQVTHEHEQNHFQQHSNLPSQLCSSYVPEKEFSKLSKYRKSKKCDVMPKEDVIERSIMSTVQQRINSVIIKNPDTKLQEHTNDSLSATNNTLTESIDNNYNIDPNSENIMSSIHSETTEDSKMLSFETAIDFSLNKTEDTKSYSCINKCNNGPHIFDDSENINLTSNTVIDKDIISKDPPVQLQINEIKEIETIDDDINNTQGGISENNASFTYKMSINDSNKENSIAVIKNISNIAEIEKYVNVQENSMSDITQEENCLSEASPVLELSVEEKLKDTKIFTEIPNVLIDKEDICLKSNLETFEFQSILNINEREITSKGDSINTNEDVCDDTKSNDILETCLEPKEAKENLSAKEIFAIDDKNINLISAIDESTVASFIDSDSEVMKKKIDDESTLYNAISAESNKEFELSGVYNEIKDIVNSTDSIKSEESKLLSEVNLKEMETDNINKELEQHEYTTSNTTSDHFEVDYTTCDNNVVSENNDNFHKNSPATNVMDTNMADLSASALTEPDGNCEDYPLLLNCIDFKSSSNELSKLNNDQNYYTKESVICEILIENQEITSNKENENIIDEDDKLNNKLILTETFEILSPEKKSGHIAKELYSPRIQKLLTFNEGYCKNISISDFASITEKIIKIDTSKEEVTEDDNKQINKDIENNDVISFPDSGSCEDQNVYCTVIKTQINDEVDKSIIIKDSGKETQNEVFLNEEKDSQSIKCASNVYEKRNVLKRSLSESALEEYKENENMSLFAPMKRKRGNHNIINPVISEDLCNIIQTNRRNSISTFYNEDNVYILIDNDLIITEEHDGTEKMYYTEIPEELSSNTTRYDSENDDHSSTNVITGRAAVETNLRDYSNNMNVIEEKTMEETWVEDVACIETVVSDDISDDFENEDIPIKKNNGGDETISDGSAMFRECEHIEKIKNIYGNNMCTNDTQILQTLYMTPQMNVNKTLDDIESHSATIYPGDKEILDHSLDNNESEEMISYNTCEDINEKENISDSDTIITTIKSNEQMNDFYASNFIKYKEDKEKCIVHSCESNNDYIMSPKYTSSNYSNSSSPEVSSTTSEEKNSSILLKITNHNGSRVSKINKIGSMDRLSYKLTEKRDYQTYNTNFSTSGTLITKAAQKYIPPLKETIRDLKIKLNLPQHRLHTLKQLQISKVEPKIDNIIKYINNNTKQEKPKKPKPKFEDVLKSIDEIQFKKHKDKVKRGKTGIPKVVIKKNVDGAHYASSRKVDDTEIFNPDLTGRKWQPWVFLEKNNFIDKMAIKKKVNAVYCHRRNGYVLAEKFRKYKSIYNANFVITQPSSDNLEKGTLKYTIRLKHK